MNDQFSKPICAPVSEPLHDWIIKWPGGWLGQRISKWVKNLKPVHEQLSNIVNVWDIKWHSGWVSRWLSRESACRWAGGHASKRGSTSISGTVSQWVSVLVNWDWVTQQLIFCLTLWLTDFRLTNWLTHLPTYWVTHWLTNCLTHHLLSHSPIQSLNWVTEARATHCSSNPFFHSSIHFKQLDTWINKNKFSHRFTSSLSHSFRPPDYQRKFTQLSDSPSFTWLHFY